MKRVRRFRAHVRRNTRSPQGSPVVAFGVRVCYWPCIKGLFISFAVGTVTLDLWHGLPSYQAADRLWGWPRPSASLLGRFIIWAVRRANTGIRYSCRVTSFAGEFGFKRFCFAWPDERVNRDGHHFYRPPWWRPFNVLLHWWRPAHGTEEMHDHPRWTVTVCLRGRLIELTPWSRRELRPGSIVFRSRKAIHAFAVPEGWRGKTWTLFIVGRRNHGQNTYAVTPR